MPRMTLVEMLLSSATVMRKSLGTSSEARAALWGSAVLAACLALREFVGQSGLEGVAGHRFGQDAFDPGVAGDDLVLARCSCR